MTRSVADKVAAKTDLSFRLSVCQHNNRSVLLPNDRMQVCFECGATKRPDEETWATPLLWRTK